LLPEQLSTPFKTLTTRRLKSGHNISPNLASTISATCILQELVERSQYRKSLTDGIGEFITGVTRYLTAEMALLER
jgi:hypothetical protein